MRTSVVTTDGELYDLLQKLFGIGDWDGDVSSQPWWKSRALEVTKIKRSRTARRVELADLALAAEYCKAHGHDIRAVTWLYKHINDARRWDNERSRAEKSRELDELVAEAIEIESSHPDSPWLDLLVRARGAYRQEVYDSWKQQRGTTSSSPPSSRSGAPASEGRRAASSASAQRSTRTA